VFLAPSPRQSALQQSGFRNLKETDMQRRPTRTDSQTSCDFDVITGPSMASACPVVETAPAEAVPADAAAPAEAEAAA